jgi:hypothetical protein
MPLDDAVTDALLPQLDYMAERARLTHPDTQRQILQQAAALLQANGVSFAAQIEALCDGLRYRELVHSEARYAAMAGVLVQVAELAQQAAARAGVARQQAAWDAGARCAADLLPRLATMTPAERQRELAEKREVCDLLYAISG